MMNNGGLYKRTGLFHNNGGLIPLEGVEAHGDIAGRAAKVQLRQRFHNREGIPIEAVYKFPLPVNAALCGFRAFVDDREIVGKIEEREKAFEIYDKALSEGHGAQLLDEERANIFTLSVGNIKPKGVVVIEIQYVMLIDTEGAEVRFNLPTTISPRYIPVHQKDQDGIPVEHIVNPPFAPFVPYGLKLHINIHNIKEIKAIGSPSHSITTEWTADKAAVSFTSETTAMDRDFILSIVYKQAFVTRGMVFANEDANYVQIDFMPEEQHDGSDGELSAGKREIVFVLDCSGSMSGSSIAQARKALEIMIKALHPGTLFNIYRFGSHYEHLFDGSKTYDEQRMREALKYLRACKADLGGTEMLAPLKEIYRDRVPDGQFRDIVLITDGQISNEFAIAGLAKEHAGRTALHAVGIGYGPNEFLIKDTARASGGASALIAPKERIEPKVLSLFKKVMDGPIRDIKVSWGGVVEQAPREVVAFSGQVTSIFARGAADVSIESMVKITGQTRSGVKTWELPLDPVGEGVPIPLLWARERIVDIEDGNMGGSLQQVRRQKKATKEIIAISKQYGIVSSKTSYVGIEKRSATDQTTAKMALRKVPAMLTKGWGGLFDARVPYYSGVAYSITAASLGANVMPLFYKRSPFPPEMYCLEKVRKIGLDKAEVDKGDFLLNLLACQQADGGFIIADNLLKMVELSDLPSIADRIAIKDTGDKKLLLMTLMTLLLLEMYYETRRSLWEGIVRKSRAWLKREMKRMQPTIDGQPLDQWLVNYLENHEGLKRLA